VQGALFLYILEVFIQCMSEEKNMEKMTSVLVSCWNLERIKAISKKGKTFDDVVTKLLIITKTFSVRSGSIQRLGRIDAKNKLRIKDCFIQPFEAFHSC
jgi:hypothetical protein